MLQTTVTPAQLVANRIGQQVNNLASVVLPLIANGQPAQPAMGNNPGTPAIPAADIQAAIGPVGMAQIDVLSAALSQTDPAKLAAALQALQ
jgi:hypothetical protein